jgi:chorismate mutase/prephenate dehydratase
MTKLDEVRLQINAIDKEMAALFEKRMECAKIVAEAKKESGAPIEDLKREKEVLDINAAYLKDQSLKEYYVLYQQNLMDVSKKYQRDLLNDNDKK